MYVHKLIVIVKVAILTLFSLVMLMVMHRLCLQGRAVILMLSVCLKLMPRCLILFIPPRMNFSSCLLMFVNASIIISIVGLALWIILSSLIGLWVSSLKTLLLLKVVKTMFSFIAGLLTATLIVGVVCILLLTYNNL